MPMQWNEQADAKLFANVLKLHVVKLDYGALAKAMGPTVTPKAISHRISKIKEKAQVRRLDWELYSNPPTSGTPRKRGPKAKITDDDDTASRKRIKTEEPAIKVEEGSYENNYTGTTCSPASIGGYYWPNEWSPTANAEDPQQAYAPYEPERDSTNQVVDADYADADGSHGNVDLDHVTATTGGDGAGTHVAIDGSSVQKTHEDVLI